jgi:hypothetical protein
MNWHLIQDKEKIIRIIEPVIAEEAEVRIYIEEIETEYASKFIAIMPRAANDNLSESANGGVELIVEKLVPESGNVLIQEFPEAGLEFFIDTYLCRCHATYKTIRCDYPYYGLMMNLPLLLELEEKRREERKAEEFSQLTFAFLRVEKEADRDQLYQSKVINHSGHGLGLIVKEKDVDLLRLLKPGDRMPEMLVFSGLKKWGAFVRHKTKIEHGKYRGNYLLGIEANLSQKQDKIPFEKA